MAAAVLGVLLPLGPIAWVLGQAPTQQPTVPPEKYSENATKFGVAVVDISYIFKKHDRFKVAMDRMKAEMDKIEADLKADQEAIRKIEQERNTFNAGTEQYRTLDDQVTRKMADFNVKMTRLRKDFLDREAKVYYQTYLEIVAAVREYAMLRQIGLVIRFNDEPIDPNQREQVLTYLNRPVVYQNFVDITPVVIQTLNRGAIQVGQQVPTGSTIPPR
jgi:Skp family chaperone for outer membrane proteins